MAYDSILSERALREIYLMPFMLAQKYAKPWCFMTSYVRISISNTVLLLEHRRRTSTCTDLHGHILGTTVSMAPTPLRISISCKASYAASGALRGSSCLIGTFLVYTYG